MLSGCGTAKLPGEHAGYEYSSPPVIEPETRLSKILRTLPEPKTRIVLSVYSFEDQTGQHKPNDRFGEFSRAVTQGGLAMLNKALLDAGNNQWFKVVERGGLQNLLQERSLIRAMREKYRLPTGEKLPDIGALLYSGVLLEGGVVGYESNVLTGGIGARYLGIGASTEYRRDVVTVALRAVKVDNGEVFLSIYTTKTIFSTGVQGGIFRFVAVDKLLESDAGFTINEPPQLAVRQAIEAAVYALIMEGTKKKLWDFDDPNDGKRAMAQYLQYTGIAPQLAEQEAAKHYAPRLANLRSPQPEQSRATPAPPQDQAAMMPLPPVPPQQSAPHASHPLASRPHTPQAGPASAAPPPPTQNQMQQQPAMQPLTHSTQPISRPMPPRQDYQLQRTAYQIPTQTAMPPNQHAQPPSRPRTQAGRTAAPWLR